MPKRIAVLLLPLLAATVTAPVARAHEFWIEPVDQTVAVGDPIVARIRVGENFKGDNLPWQPDRVFEAGISDTDGDRPIDGMVGDLPAIRATAGNPGLNLLHYYSRPSTLTHTQSGTFEAYLRETGQDDLLEVHEERGLPATGFVEAYSRCAKALVQVGDGEGRDRLTGMPLELLAEANPYTDAGDLPVRLYWLGEPISDVQVTVFRKGGNIAVTRLHTDRDGRVVFSLSPGDIYLVSAVKMIPRDDETSISWHSYWASLTFQAGAR